MVHKISLAMGKRDDEYVLAGSIELDEGFFSTEVPEDKKQEPLNPNYALGISSGIFKG